MNRYCVQTKPRTEENVVQYLTGVLKLETYYPRLRLLTSDF